MRMVLIDDFREFTEGNCERCVHGPQSVDLRPCRWNIPIRFNKRMWYPLNCPFMQYTPLTDEEKIEANRLLDEVLTDLDRNVLP